MGRTRDTVDIVKALIASCTPTLSITDSVDHADGTYTLSIPNTYWLRISKRIDIGGIEYRVTALEINESITISGPSEPVVDSFTIPAPHFFHGVLQMASIEQGKEADPTLRTPFVYLYEVLDEEVINDELEIWGRNSKPRLYFMDEALTEWSPEQHKENVIEPVRQMVELFFTKIADEKDNLYAEVLNRDEIARADWGKFIVEKGNEKKFFSDQISGLQVGFDFSMSKAACGDITTVISGGVTSFEGRVGAVVSDVGDYSASEITNDSSVTGTNVGEALDNLNTTAKTEYLTLAASDETTDLTTGTAKVTFRMPYAMNLTEVRASVTTGPTGATLIVDIHDGGTSIMTTNKLQILTGTTIDDGTAVITDTNLADKAEVTIDIDQIGSTIAGAGLKVILIGTRA